MSEEMRREKGENECVHIDDDERVPKYKDIAGCRIVMMSGPDANEGGHRS